MPIRTARIVRDYTHAANLGATRTRRGWLLGATLCISSRTIRAGGTRGLELDRAEDPDQLLDSTMLEHLAPSLAVRSSVRS
jgi:hypothetical protein